MSPERANLFKLARRRQELNATLRSLDVPRPDMYYKISVACDMHDLLMIPQAEVTTHDLLTRPPITVFFLHNVLLN
jgi:hypothetical protein